jgi:hypothetical protein
MEDISINLGHGIAIVGIALATTAIAEGTSGLT